MNFIKRNALWLFPIFFLLLFAPFSVAIDMEIASRAYSEANKSFSTNNFYDIVFRFGCIPAQASCGIAVIYFLLSYYSSRYHAYRKTALAVALPMIIGAGLLTITFFKEHWGRPRPRQVEQFGGTQAFRPFYVPSLSKPPVPSKSFPSGHSTCGFYFFIFFFLGRRFQNRLLESIGLLAAFGLGIFLCITRIVQGGHFLSDTLFAAFLMWETAYFVDWLVFEYAPLTQRLAK